jgi:integration host factor subunit alpha
MTKNDIIDSVYERLGAFSKREATDMVETLIDLMKDGLVREGKVKITGFGTFMVRNKGPRPGRNPRTGKTIVIAPRRVVGFKASKVLRDLLNK